MRELSTPAKAAKQIRDYLKSTGLKARVTSEQYSGGSSLNVYVTDLKPELAELVGKLVKRYQYGHFDGMTDCYEYSNHNDDLPQVRHAFLNNQLSDGLRNEIYQHLRSSWAGGEELPETYEDGKNLNFHAEWVSEAVYRQFRDANSTFWKSRNKTEQAA